MQSRARAMEALLGLLTDQPVIICNGFPSREAFKIADRPTHFYMIGSMGVAAAIGLGVALSKPQKKVIVFDGDGNVLMGMGTLATVGAIIGETAITNVISENTSARLSAGKRSLTSACEATSPTQPPIA